VSPAPPTEAQRRQQALQALLQDVQAQPWAHDYFALLRRIDALRPEAPRTGTTLRPQQEALRYAQPPEMDFAPAPLSGLALRDDLPPRLSVRFFGLLGPQGPLPLHLTEYVRDRQHQHGDSNPAHFLDLFHHRLLALFYRAWAQAQPVVQGDRPQDDRFRAWLAAAAGLPAAAGALPPAALAYHAGLLAGRSRHPEALCKVLRHQFGVPVALQPNQGHWLLIEPEDRSRLGHAGNRAERSLQPAARLGQMANAGHRAWDRQYRFRLRMGPLTLEQYESFLPGGHAWEPLNAWVSLLAGPALRWELELTLTPDARPEPRLGSRPRLGVSTWLGRRDGSARASAGLRALRLRPGTSFLQRRHGA
jgi:type VI secretion system protein ImpH